MNKMTIVLSIHIIICQGLAPLYAMNKHNQLIQSGKKIIETSNNVGHFNNILATSTTFTSLHNTPKHYASTKKQSKTFNALTTSKNFDNHRSFNKNNVLPLVMITGMGSVAALLLQNNTFAADDVTHQQPTATITHEIGTSSHTGQCYQLVITVPHGFVKVPPIIPGGSVIEYRSASEDPDLWSEHITIQHLAYSKLSASDMINHLAQIFTNVYHGTLVERTTENHDDHESATVAIAYQDKGRQEVVFMHYFSQNNTLTGFQYACPVPEGTTPQDVLKEMDAVIKKGDMVRVKVV